MNMKAKAAAKTKTVDPETGVILERIDPKSVDVYLSKLRLDGAGSINDRVKRLAAFFKSKVTVANEAVCECGGRSDMRLLACPFCGDASVDPALGEIQGGGEDDAIKELVGAPPAKQELVPVPERRRRRSEAMGKGEGAVKAAPSVGVDAAADLSRIRADELVPASGSEPKVPAIVEGAKATVEMLDQSVRKIHDLVGKTFEANYDLGRALLENFQAQLWLQRKDAKGAPVYDSWKDFVEKEIPVSVRYTYSLMQIAERFVKAAFMELGIAKSLLIIRIPEDDASLPEVISSASKQSVGTLKNRVVEIAGGVPEGARSETEIGKAIGGGLWDRAAMLLGQVIAEVGRDRLAIASKLGVEKRTVIRWMAQLEENGHADLAKTPLREAAKESGAKAQHVRKGPPPVEAKASKPPLAPEPKKKAPKSAPLLMVPVTLGRVRIPLFARPALRGAEAKPAKRIADDPWAVEVLENDVKVRYRIEANAKGFLQLIIDRTKA